LQLDAWFEKANAGTLKTLRARPIDRLIEELVFHRFARVRRFIQAQR
jgi:hypothetical protein